MSVVILTCGKCGVQFKPFVYIGIKRVPLYGRKYCTICVPYKGLSKYKFVGVIRRRTRNTSEDLRQCRICGDYKPVSMFSPTNRRGNLNSYCKSCAAKKKKAPTQRFKAACIEYKGGKCSRCGYDNCPAALEFHHRDPTQKDFAISRSRTVILTDEIRRELDKCDLICSNCHKEEHYLVVEGK